MDAKGQEIANQNDLICEKNSLNVANGYNTDKLNNFDTNILPDTSTKSLQKDKLILKGDINKEKPCQNDAMINSQNKINDIYTKNLENCEIVETMDSEDISSYQNDAVNGENAKEINKNTKELIIDEVANSNDNFSHLRDNNIVQKHCERQINMHNNTSKYMQNQKKYNDVELVACDDIEDDIFIDNSDGAIEIWGQILLDLKNGDDKFLYAMCSDIIKCRLVNNDFIIYTNLKDDYELLNQNEKKQALQNALNKFIDKNLKIVFDEYRATASSDIAYLREKFGDDLVIKNDNYI